MKGIVSALSSSLPSSSSETTWRMGCSTIIKQKLNIRVSITTRLHDCTKEFVTGNAGYTSLRMHLGHDTAAAYR